VRKNISATSGVSWNDRNYPEEVICVEEKEIVMLMAYREEKWVCLFCLWSITCSCSCRCSVELAQLTALLPVLCWQLWLDPEILILTNMRIFQPETKSGKRKHY